MKINKLSNKGFTLIELLATILIIGLVLGLTAYGIISSVGSAKETGTTLSIKGIKEAARTYSDELGEDSWKNINDNENSYFCVTIEELINKGLLNKNAKNIESGGKLVDYVVVIKNKSTKVIKKEELLTEDSSETDAYKICTGNIKNEQIKSNTKIDGSDSYTDTIDIKFTDPTFESEITDRYCEYGDSSTNMNMSGDINDGICSLNNLKQNNNYYARVCVKSKRESVSCSDTTKVSTKEIVAPEISINTSSKNSIKITYYSDYIKGESSYYFKSTIDGIADKNVKYCRFSNNYNCDGGTKVISKNTWYKVDDKEVILSYTNSGDITITAVTRDKSGNYKSTDKNYSLYKTVFNRGTADKIDGQTSNVERLCLADQGKTCSITSPSIERAGYNVIGWNTNSSATTSTWNVSVSKNINKSETYYPIVSLKQYTISYKTENGSGTMSNQTVSYGDNITIKENTFVRDGYTFIGWTTKSDGTDDGYNWTNWSGKWEFKNGQHGIANNQLKLYARWRINVINIKYDMNGGTLSTDNTAYGTSGSYVTLNGSTIVETYNYSAQIGKNGLSNYNNSKYINIVRSGYSAVSNKEWACSSGNCKSDTYNQSSQYYANDFCDASKGDCTVVLKVNWKLNKVFIKFSTNGGKLNYELSNNEYQESNEIIFKNNSDVFFAINYGEDTGDYGLPNYDNSGNLYITKDGYIGVSGAEWKCLSGNCKSNTYNQLSKYSASNFCDASKGDCTVVLGVNWERYKKIDDYRCDANGEYYWVTYCRGNECYYTRKGCDYNATGSLSWNTTIQGKQRVTDCEAKGIYGDRCVGNDKYYITTCTAARCNYTKKNGTATEGVIYDRCTLSTNCAESTKTMYITAKSGLNCRSGAGSTYRVVTSYACGVAIKVKSESTKGWYYSVNDNCYSTGEYLSTTQPTNCNSGGFGGDTGGSGGDGFFSNCYCNSNSDCGVSGTKIQLWCDKNAESGNLSKVYKYKCAWKNATTFGGFSNSEVHYCVW